MEMKWDSDDVILDSSISEEIPKTNLITTTSQDTGSVIELAIISINSQTENIDEVSVTASPSEILETLEAASPVTPLMASPAGEANGDDDDENGYSLTPVKVMSVIHVSLFVFITLLLILEILSLELWRWCLAGSQIIFCGNLLWEGSKINIFPLSGNNPLHGMNASKFLPNSYSTHKRNVISLWISIILSAENVITENLITMVVGFACFVVNVWMVRADVIETLYASFYNKSFSKRSNQDRVHQYILQTLSEPPVRELSEVHSSSSSSESGSGSNVIDPQRIICNMIETASQDGFYTLPNKLDYESSNNLMNPDDEHNNRIMTAEREAKAAGDLIFKNVSKPGYKYIEEEDLLRFMNKDYVDMVLPLIGRKDASGRINEKSFLKWVVSMYTKSKFLGHSINDIEKAMMALCKYVNGLVIVVLVNLSVTAMSIGIGITIKGWIILQICQFLLAVFTIFGCSLKSTYDGMIFVFKKHPFDVGDHCVIDGVQVFIEKVSILTTVALGHYNQKLNLPNSTLDTKSIINFNRSPEMRDTMEFDVDFSASVVNVSALKAKIKTYIDSNPHLWKPEHSVLVREIEDVHKMKMRLYVTHTINFQDYEEISDRRSDLVLELGNIFHQLRIKYHIHPPKSCD